MGCQEELEIYPKAMRDVYQRMKTLGFDRKFIQAAFLPDWWDDALAEKPANRALAESSISKWTGIPVGDLRTRDKPLQFPASCEVRLKRTKRSGKKDLQPAIAVAQRAARLAVRALPVPRRFEARHNALELRDRILEKQAYIGLPELVALCWQLGVVVLHIASLPSASRRFDGVAMYVDETPTIVLASNRDGYAWLAFHLAHELAHVLESHVEPGGEALADLDLSRVADDDQERMADRTAMLLLTGMESPQMDVLHGVTGTAFARLSQELIRQYRIDPGVAALVYGRSTNRWGVAENALKALQRNSGGKDVVRTGLREELPVGELSESERQFLESLGAL